VDIKEEWPCFQRAGVRFLLPFIRTCQSVQFKERLVSAMKAHGPSEQAETSPKENTQTLTFIMITLLFCCLPAREKFCVLMMKWLIKPWIMYVVNIESLM